jgi:CheY-like chemotaxis protein
MTAASPSDATVIAADVPRVLVIDDDEAIRLSLATALEFEGYAVVTAEHGGAALALVDQFAPDLILTDMRMPVVSGWEFIRQLRERGGHAPIVIVAAAPQTPTWAQELNVNGYLLKPFTLDEVFATVARWSPPAAQ